MESRKMTGTKGSNVAARVYVVDGKPLKSILKKPKELRAGIANNVAEGVVYNRNFPRLGTNSESKAKDGAGKPSQVRRKVAIAHDDSNTVWEVAETDFASPLKSVWVEEPVTCDRPPHEVFGSTANEVDFSNDTGPTHIDDNEIMLNVMDNLETPDNAPNIHNLSLENTLNIYTLTHEILQNLPVCFVIFISGPKVTKRTNDAKKSS
ncbi:hypothetical protein Tco_0262278 [Tanacetum coccineum]